MDGLFSWVVGLHSNVEELADTAEDHEDTGDEVDDAAVGRNELVCQSSYLSFGKSARAGWQ